MIKTKKKLNTFMAGIDQDTIPTKYDATHFFDAQNMRVISNDPLSTGGETNVVGNTIKMMFPIGDIIIGFCKIRAKAGIDLSKDSIVFFTCNSAGTKSSIYLFEGDPFMVSELVVMTPPITNYTSMTGYNYRAGLIYDNSGLHFDQYHPIKAEGRYESDDIRKVYWVDGLNSIRYMILDRVQPTDAVTSFDIIPTAILDRPTTTTITGGGYQSGQVQHAYQLYIKNGAASIYSPLSYPLYLTANDSGLNTDSFGGSELGANTGKGVNIVFNNLDPLFNRIRIVALHYTEYLINPIVNIVGELEYSGTTTSFVDNGITTYGTVPIEEFRLFAQTEYTANSIATKNNYLFFADIFEERWTPDWLDPNHPNFYDVRAVRYKNSGGVEALVSDVDGDVTIQTPANALDPASWDAANWLSYGYTHNGINIYNDIANDDVPANSYKYQSDGSTLGAEGKNVIVSFHSDAQNLGLAYSFTNISTAKWAMSSPYVNSPITERINFEYIRGSQRTEVYRIFIVFYNLKLQPTAPQWVCDLRMPTNDEFNMVSWTPSTSFANAISPRLNIRNYPIGEIYRYQMFRCERGSNDRSVMASGVISPLQETTLRLDGYDQSQVSNILQPMSQTQGNYAFYRAEDLTTPPTSTPIVNKKFIEIVSPELCFNRNLTYMGGDKLRVDGRYNTSVCWYTGHDPIYLTTIGFKQTGPTSISDVKKYNIVEGLFQNPQYAIGDKAIGAGVPSLQSIGGKNYLHMMWSYDIEHFIRTGKVAYEYGNRGYNFIANIDTDLSVDELTTGCIMGSYLRDVFNVQYGGNTYEARSYNSCIPYSDVTVPGVEARGIYGDTFITMFGYLRSGITDGTGMFASIFGDIFQKTSQEWIYIPCESSINTYYRTDEPGRYLSLTSDQYWIQNNADKGIELQPTDYPVDLGDLYSYNSVYSKSLNGMVMQNTVFDSNVIEHNDVKIIASGKKINNEYYDQWTNIFTNNNIQLDPKYGPIRNIFNFENRLFAGQDKAIATIAVNERSLIQDNNQLQLVLGTGGVLERFDYLTVTSGFQNYFDMLLSDKGCYYIDRRNKIFNSFSMEQAEMPISEAKGYRSFFKSYGPITEVKTGYDPIYKEVFMYVSDGTKKYNSVFDEYVGAFVGKHTFEPDRMLNLNDQFYSTQDNTVWIHNQGEYGNFYGVPQDSWITLLINPEGVNVSKFDILDLRVDLIDPNGDYIKDAQFDRMEVSNSYQTTNKVITFSGDDSAEDISKNIIGKWRTWLLPDDKDTEFNRFVDTYLKVKLIKDNTENNKIILHDATTYYRPTKN